MEQIKVIFWDFDGVLLDSNPIRDLGFEQVLAGFPYEQVEQLLAFHRANGGLSRYVKFRYFFEQIRRESTSEEDIRIWAARFSSVVKAHLTNPDLLIRESLDFVRRHQGVYTQYITSGSDQEELRHVCSALQIDHLFASIHGSPTPKKAWIRNLMALHGYHPQTCVLIGDSMNDWEAARDNQIFFKAYNNPALEGFSDITFFS